MERELFIDTEKKENNENKDRKREIIFIIVRSVVLLLLLISLFINTFNGFALVKKEIICMNDQILDLTMGISEYLEKNVSLRKFLLILTSLSMDVFMLIFLIIWIKKGNTWRPIITIIEYFLLFILSQLIFQKKTPTLFLMKYTGFPSIFLPFNRNYYFAFSSGLPFICFLELHNLKMKRLSLLYIFICFYVSIILLFLRGHYIIDIISGIIFAHYCYYMTEKIFSKYDFYKECN